VTGKSACWNSAWRLLESELLVVAVNRLLRVEVEWPTRLTVLAIRDLDFHVGFLLERSKSSPALVAIEHDILQLRENTTSSGNNTTNTHQAIQMGLAQLAESVVNWQVRNTNMNLRMNAFVIGIMKKSGLHGNLVEQLKHLSWSIRQEVRQDSLRRREVVV
jgi:hypothetical protein